MKKRYRCMIPETKPSMLLAREQLQSRRGSIAGPMMMLSSCRSLATDGQVLTNRLSGLAGAKAVVAAS